MNGRAVPKWLRVLVPTALIVVWFALAGIGGPYFGRIEEVSDIDLTAFLPESAEATRVNEEAAKYRDDKLIPALLVFEAKDDGINETDAEAINQAVEPVQELEAVSGDISPAIVADDEQAAFVTIPLNADSELGEALTEIKAEIKGADLKEVNYYATGPAGFSSDLNVAFAGIDGLLLAVALAVVFVILLLVYRSPLLPILVLMTSIFALAAAILLVWQLAFRDIVQLNGQVQGILFILVIGAATDYSLLYVSRYREELTRYQETWRATLQALKGSFEPILASGGTVIVGLLCLLISDLGSNQALGPVGSIGIALAMLAALTLLPALLLAFGRVSFWPFRPKYDPGSLAVEATELHKGFWPRVGKLVAAYPRRIWVIVTVVLLVAVAGVWQLKADGVAQSDLILGYSEAREGQAVLSRHFPDGSGSPALVTAPVSTQDEFVTAFENDPGVDSVSVTANDSPSGLLPLGREAAAIRADIREEVEAEVTERQVAFESQAEQYAALYGPAAAQQFVEQMSAGAPSVDELVEDIYPFSEATPKVIDDRVLLQVTLNDAPDSEAAKATVERLRDITERVDERADVGGVTAVQLDTNNASIRDRTVIIPLVLAAITFILMLLLRSIIAPILLLLTTVISFGTTLGIAALLFNHVWQFPGADPSVVLYGFVFLVALGIDYNIFLMTRVREETFKVGTRKGVIKGLVVTGGVITSAGIVLAATFAALAVIPILFLAQLAFIVAFGVLLDTLIVRSLLVPALIRDAGAIVWWPSKLTRRE